MPRLLAICLVLLPGTVRAGDWPQWRGRDRDGHAHGAKLPKTWAESAPKPLWTTKVGEGQSSPVVSSGRVFLLGRVGDQEVCYGLNAGSGKIEWKHAYGCKYQPADASAGTGPKSTPTVDGDRVYMLGVAGMLHCFRTKDGEVIWKKDLNAEFWGVEKDQWGDDAYCTCCGAAAAPLIDGKQLLLPVGGKKAGAVTAFDKETGKVRWKSPLTDRSTYGSGVIAELGGRKQLVGFTGLRLGGFSPGDGKLLWDHAFPAAYEQTILTPIVYKDLVVFGGEERETIALKIAQNDGKSNAKQAWKNDRLKAYMTSPVAVQDHLYGLSKRGELVCVALADGKTAWAAGNFGAYGTLAVAGQTLFVLTRQGELHIIEANPKKFTRLARWTVSKNPPCWSHLALVGGRLFVKDKTDVHCIDLADQ